MGDLLDTLAARALGLSGGVRPRVPARFESVDWYGAGEALVSLEGLPEETRDESVTEIERMGRERVKGLADWAEGRLDPSEDTAPDSRGLATETEATGEGPTDSGRIDVDSSREPVRGVRRTPSPPVPEDSPPPIPENTAVHPVPAPLARSQAEAAPALDEDPPHRRRARVVTVPQGRAGPVPADSSADTACPGEPSHPLAGARLVGRVIERPAGGVFERPTEGVAEQPSDKSADRPADRYDARPDDGPRRADDLADTRTVIVTIGRVEVRAAPTAPTPPRPAVRPQRPRPALTLGEHLARHRGGRI